MDAEMETVIIFTTIDILAAILLRYAFPTTDPLLLLPFLFLVGFIFSIVGYVFFPPPKDHGDCTCSKCQRWGWISAVNILLFIPAGLLAAAFYVWQMTKAI
jgi:hypothetical protein